jgi:hypothetical protein
LQSLAHLGFFVLWNPDEPIAIGDPSSQTVDRHFFSKCCKSFRIPKQVKKLSLVFFGWGKFPGDL